MTCFQAASQIKRTVHIAFAIMLVNLVGALYFSNIIGHLGIALASTISQMAQTVLLFCFLRELGLRFQLKTVFTKSIVNSVLLSLFLIATVWLLKNYIIPIDTSIIISIIIQIAVGMISFLLPAYLTKNRELNELKGLIVECIKKGKPEL